MRYRKIAPAHGGEKLSDVDSVEAWARHRSYPRIARVGLRHLCEMRHITTVCLGGTYMLHTGKEL
jgi:hypothetical protein